MKEVKTLSVKDEIKGTIEEAVKRMFPLKSEPDFCIGCGCCSQGCPMEEARKQGRVERNKGSGVYKRCRKGVLKNYLVRQYNLYKSRNSPWNYLPGSKTLKVFS